MILAKMLLGYRDDLDLASRWWHRLMKVVGIIAVILVGGFVFVLLSSSPYYPKESEIERIVSLREMTQKAPSDLVNTIPVFLGIEGELGALKDGRINFVSEYSLGKGVCSADLAANADAVAAELNEAAIPGGNYSAHDIRSMMERDAKELKPGEDKRYCIYDGEAVPFMSSEIIKYKRTWKATARQYGSASIWTLAWMAAFSLIALNLYYRGVIYIAFGKRRLAVPPATEKV